MGSSVLEDAFFRRAMEEAPYGTWATDANGRTIYANERMAELLGTTVAQMLGHPLQPFLASAEGISAETHWAYWHSRTPGHHQLRLARSDGHTFDALLATSPILDEAGTYLGTFALVIDISARAALTRNLEAREWQLSAAEHSAHLGSWSWIIASDHVQWSDELYRIYGLEPQSVTITFEGYLQRVHPDDRQRCADRVRAALESMKPASFEERIVWPDGSIRQLISQCDVILGADGKPERMIGICMDVTDRRRGEEQLDFLAHHDPITGLANRFVLLERAEQALTRAQGRSGVTGFLLIDLDRFRGINDTRGHLIGDLLLAAVGARLLHTMRPSDTVARTGGDEFIVLLPALHEPGDAATAAEKVLAAFHSPFSIEGESFTLSASIGISCGPYDGADVPTLLKHADLAMYRAKALGRSTYHSYSDDIGERASEVHRITSALDQAITHGELSLVYQPCVRLSDGHVTRVEALLRWTHPELGSISPAQFIPLAEETGQIVAIGRWVLRTACDQVAQWREAGLAMQLAVNVSVRQLLDDTFVDVVRGILAETRFRAEDLEFEITESTTVHDYPVVSRMLIALGELGIKFAIDDFGTGYSSLTHLKRLPIDRLKIDRSFVEGLPDDRTSCAMVKAIIAMARALEMETIAEGVETAEQLDALASMACEEVQGYYLARPLAPAALAAAVFRDTSIGSALRLVGSNAQRAV